MYQHPHGYLSQGLEKQQTKYFNERFHLAQVIAKNKCEHFRGTPCISVAAAPNKLKFFFQLSSCGARAH